MGICEEIVFSFLHTVFYLKKNLVSDTTTLSVPRLVGVLSDVQLHLVILRNNNEIPLRRWSDEVFRRVEARWALHNNAWCFGAISLHNVLRPNSFDWSKPC